MVGYQILGMAPSELIELIIFLVSVGIATCGLAQYERESRAIDRWSAEMDERFRKLDEERLAMRERLRKSQEGER
jgi:hypothetical protein